MSNRGPIERRSRRALARSAAALVAIAALGACGGGGDDDSSSPEVDATTAPEVGTTDEAASTGPDSSVDGADPDATDSNAPGEADAPDPDDLAAPANLTSADICRLIPATVVAQSAGLESPTASPGTGPTPQCSYTAPNGSGGMSELTVAALRAEEDLAGRVGREAFDYVIDTNLALAAGTDVERQTISAGDRAEMLSGAAVHMVVVQLDGRIVTVLQSAADSDGSGAAALAAHLDPLAP